MTLNYSIYKHIQQTITDLVRFLHVAQITAACSNETTIPLPSDV